MTAAQKQDNSGARRMARRLDNFASKPSIQRIHPLSPNDVLVQIALPLVLILAITARLTMMAHSMVAGQRANPVIMELWKQQVILRTEQVLNAWEKESGLLRFPDLQRVQWKHNWPDDALLAGLFSRAGELNDPQEFRKHLLAAVMQEQFDTLPEALRGDADIATWPSGFTDESRAFATDLIDQRCRRWEEHISELQWELLARIAVTLPVTDATSDGDMQMQMRKLAKALDKRDYPLLKSVQKEYGFDEPPMIQGKE